MARGSARRGYWWKKLIAFIVAVIIGIVLTLGGIVGVGYWFLTKKTAGEVLGGTLELSDTVAELTLLDYAAGVIGALGNFGSLSIGEIEDTVGYRISRFLNEMMGTPEDALRASTFSDLPETMMEHMTLVTAKEKFGISFPSLPLFEDESFLNQPLTTAFESMNDYPLDCFIEIVYDEDATEAKPASSKLLQKLGKLPLSHVSADMQGVIDDSTLREVVGIGSSHIWSYLADKKLSELDAAMDNMLLSDAIRMGAFDEDGNPVDEAGHALVCVTDEDGNSVWGYYEDETFVESEQARGNTHIVLWKLRNSQVDALDKDMEAAIADTTIGEMIDIGPDAPQLLQALSDTKLTSEALSARINEFTISDVYKDADAGILGMVPNNTKLEDFPMTIANSVNTSTLYRLHVLGIVNVNLANSTTEVRSRIYNRTVSEILNDYIALMANPSLDMINAERVTRKVKFTGNTLTQEALDALNVKQGDTVVLTQNTTIPAGTQFDFAFNILADYDDLNGVYSDSLPTDLDASPATETVTAASYTLTIEEDVAVAGFGYMYVQTADGATDSNLVSAEKIKTRSRQDGDPEDFDGVYVDAVLIDFVTK